MYYTSSNWDPFQVMYYTSMYCTILAGNVIYNEVLYHTNRYCTILSGNVLY